jgi:hypothetical protein
MEGCSQRLIVFRKGHVRSYTRIDPTHGPVHVKEYETARQPSFFSNAQAPILHAPKLVARRSTEQPSAQASLFTPEQAPYVKKKQVTPVVPVKGQMGLFDRAALQKPTVSERPSPKAPGEMSREEFENALETAPTNRHEETTEQDWGTLRGQRGAMGDMTLQGKKQYVDTLGKLPLDDRKEAHAYFENKPQGLTAYAQGRSMGLSHDHAMLVGYEKTGEIEPGEAHKRIVEDHKARQGTPTPVVPRVAKEPYEMTKDEYAGPEPEPDMSDPNERGQRYSAHVAKVGEHFEHVKAALKAGKDVPAAVMADYLFLPGQMTREARRGILSVARTRRLSKGRFYVRIGTLPHVRKSHAVPVVLRRVA